jgi:ferrochelatase
MRHWFPYIREAVARIVEDGIGEVVALCMAPHYSRMSIGAYFRKVEEAQQELGVKLKLHLVESWHTHPGYIQAICEKVEAALAEFPAEDHAAVQIVFSAHSLPASIVEQGDPYDRQLRETAALAAERLGLPAEQWQFCYQSAAAGATRWLGPPIETVIAELADAGHTQILVAPIGFVADHVEVLYDLDVEGRRIAEAHGARLVRAASQNASPTFIATLADVVRQAVAR